MTVVKSQSFCGGQNGLTILAKTQGIKAEKPYE